ncbi:hypothetical protein QQZ08_000210 [Neonectria magnoliae]|uniref:Uncharacterized protein n=1 Tax=Neonectria magnoliae TaxID=2732573 RepID=A0ABR1IHZ7_9HYPO
MTRVSILYLKQPDSSDKRNCLRVELRDFQDNPRLCNDDKTTFDEAKYVGPAILVIEDHDEPEGEDGMRRAIGDLLRKDRRFAFPDQMVDALLRTDDCKVPEYTSHDPYSRDIWSIIKYRGRHGPLHKTQSWLSQEEVADFTKLQKRKDTNPKDKLYRYVD